MRRRTRRRMLAFSSIAAAAGVVAAVVLSSSANTSASGSTISSGELSYYRTLAAAGALPAASTDAALRNQILTDRAVLKLAHAHHVATDVASVDDLLNERNAANASASAGNGNLPVYGAGSYGVVAFYGRALTQLRTATFDAMTGGEHPVLQVSDAAIGAEVKNHPDAWSAGATTYAMTRLVVPWTVKGTSGQAVLTRTTAICADPAQAAATIPGAAVTTVTLHGSGLATSGLSPDAQSALTGLALGACLPPQTDDRHWALYRLDTRTVDENAAITLYRPQVRQQLLQSQFDALVAATAAHLRDTSSTKGTS